MEPTFTTWSSVEPLVPVLLDGRRHNGCAFESAWQHYHAQNRPLFYMLATMLNSSRLEGRPFGVMQRDDHCLGQNVDAPLPDLYEHAEVILPNYDTALTYAVRHNLPYCTRWLIVGRGARIDVANGDGLVPFEVAMKAFPVLPPPQYATVVRHAAWEQEVKRWTDIVWTLKRAGATARARWATQYPSAFAHAA